MQVKHVQSHVTVSLGLGKKHLDVDTAVCSFEYASCLVASSRPTE